ncbi:FMN-binding negative transcriptional regulator [Rhodalgimonas zhirmunskyi]|uniref:FMN-binding negative transcriptional regulator n=1 Tax=Rhodalgimonas zhirmunskyi TaxID=2964767 RepID=A0AAJ1X719_9RHOB|nr:FMN-binding negative transcriptional regulator [Rhodoalgimonas zhirmunskyi]MDQ2094072.1 FMN-binding negative transcriptional regulator [Rhodoalgimonas zhirmunskyi]
MVGVLAGRRRIIREAALHTNPAFRPNSTDESFALAREIGFGMLAVSADGAAPLLSHVPFLIGNDSKTAQLHLTRSNPIARACDTVMPARIAVQGPHSYISPDWYGLEDQVPTWNYLAIHLTGTLVALPDETLPDMLAQLSHHFEERLAPKPEWGIDKMPEEVFTRMLRQIRSFQFRIDSVDATWKLSQNKPEGARQSAADHVAAYGIGQETRILAALMRKPPQGPDRQA